MLIKNRALMLSNILPVLAMSCFAPRQSRNNNPSDPPPELPALDPSSLSEVVMTVRLPSVRLLLDAIPPPLPVLNPLLRVNDQRLTDRDVNGFGPARVNAEKKALGIKCMDQPICTDASHETKRCRKNKYRSKIMCRWCVKEVVESIPPTATRWQTTRYLTALFRNYFCPFCMLQCDSNDKLHLKQIRTKSHCRDHSAANSQTKCPAHEKEWKNCTECKDDPRSATLSCACGGKLGWGCACPNKGISYGIRLHTNPFIAPTAEVKAQEDIWAVDCIARATVMQASNVCLPPKKRGPGAGKTLGVFIHPV